MSLTEVLLLLSIATSLTILVTFLKARKSEAESRGARQADLDNAIKQISDSIKSLIEQIKAQQGDIDRLKLWLELLLQQHNHNHNQEIRRTP